MAEGLGSGLQNRVQQFESAWYLKIKRSSKTTDSFFRLNYNLPFQEYFFVKKNVYPRITLIATNFA